MGAAIFFAPDGPRAWISQASTASFITLVIVYLSVFSELSWPSWIMLQWPLKVAFVSVLMNIFSSSARVGLLAPTAGFSVWLQQTGIKKFKTNNQRIRVFISFASNLAHQSQRAHMFSPRARFIHFTSFLISLMTTGKLCRSR